VPTGGMSQPHAGPMTWTKLGDEFSDEARDLTDAEYRTHSDALIWSNRRGLDLLVPKRDLRKFGESPLADDAPEGLIAKGWWADEGDHWNIGLRFPEWQLERAVIKQRQEANALRVRRSRMHKAGDHSICVVGNCPAAAADVMHYDTRDETRDDMRDPGRVGTGLSAPTDPLTDQSQTPSQDQTQNRRGTTPRTPRGHPPSSGDRDVDARSKPARGKRRAAGEPQAEAAPAKEGSATNSQTRRVRHGSETVADDVPGFSPNDAESTTAGTTRVRTREPHAPAA
jgi:hypothetical protein